MDLLKQRLLVLTTVLLIALVLVVPACKKAKPPAALPPLKVNVAPKPAASTGSEAGVETEGMAKAFVYNPEDVRDPFLSLLQIKQTELGIPIEDLPPLQRLPVTDLKVEGIILMGRKSVAHILTPDGKAHIAAVGTKLGRNKGRIIRILSDTIVVEEEFENYLGKKFNQETMLKLRLKEGESL